MSIRQRAVAILSVPLIATACSFAWACGGYGSLDFDETPDLVAQLGDQARDVDSTDETELDAVIETLRRRGYTGLDAAIAYVDLRAGQTGEAKPEEIKRLDRAVDKIAGQKFARQSKLYWHTSLDTAKVRARKTNRPILSLRMLGRLDENLSCANSRFFRTTLYPHHEIATLLREQFVLHWKPVRDVPVVTIDFGNGRKIEQPLTGNSAHLVLDSQGRPIDALPGLVSPREFQRWLRQVQELWQKVDTKDEAAFWAAITDHHRERAQRRRQESPLAIAENQKVAELNPLDPRWTEFASKHPVELAAVSHQLLNRQQPAEAAMRIAPMKSFAEVPILRMVQSAESMIARDTVFNLYALQTRIDDWFAAVGGPMDYGQLTELIYSDVFLMPLSDPWLGLSPEQQYAALDNGGRIEPDGPAPGTLDLSSFLELELNSTVPR